MNDCSQIHRMPKKPSKESFLYFRKLQFGKFTTPAARQKEHNGKYCIPIHVPADRWIFIGHSRQENFRTSWEIIAHYRARNVREWVTVTKLGILALLRHEVPFRILEERNVTAYMNSFPNQLPITSPENSAPHFSTDGLTTSAEIQENVMSMKYETLGDDDMRWQMNDQHTIRKCIMIINIDTRINRPFAHHVYLLMPALHNNSSLAGLGLLWNSAHSGL